MSTRAIAPGPVRSNGRVGRFRRFGRGRAAVALCVAGVELDNLSNRRRNVKQMIVIGVSAVLAFAGACGKSGGSGGGGGVDKAAFKAMNDGIKSGDAWAPTAAAVDKVMGPAKIKNDAQWTWAVDDGEDCYEVELLKSSDGAKVMSVGGGQVNKMVEKPYARCAARAKGTVPAAPH